MKGEDQVLPPLLLDPSHVSQGLLQGCSCEERRADVDKCKVAKVLYSFPQLFLWHSSAGQLCLGWVDEHQLLQLLAADHLHQQLLQPQAQLLLLDSQYGQLLCQPQVRD